MGLKLDKIEQNVEDSLRDLHERSKCWSNAKHTLPEYTHEVKNSLRGIGDNLGFTVCGSDENHGWLYDLCWREQDKGLDRSMPLAMESEWAQGFCAILEDFQKLLVSRADHRVFICSQPTPEDWMDCLVLLIEQIRRHRETKKGDRYLFGCWLSDGWQFQQYVHPTRPIPRPKHVWLFGANKERYDLTKKLKRLKEDWWDVKCYREHRLRPGDTVLLWQSGAQAGIYGIGELTSEAYQEGDDWFADIRYNGLLDDYIPKSDLRERPLLRDLAVIKMPRGRNPFRVYDKEWKALQKLISVSGR